MQLFLIAALITVLTGEGGEIENPELSPKFDEILQWCKTPEQALDKLETVTIDFVKGVPTALNGEKQPLAQMIAKLNSQGGAHGVGVFQLIEDRIVGLKVRGVYENPAASILIAAHRKLEMLVSTREENELKLFMDNKWAYLTYGAKYFDPTMQHLRAYIDSQNAKVTGSVRVSLYKGNITVTACSSPNSLFSASLATFNKSDAFNQNASSGFIELYTLPMRTAYQLAQAQTTTAKKA